MRLQALPQLLDLRDQGEAVHVRAVSSGAALLIALAPLVVVMVEENPLFQLVQDLFSGHGSMISYQASWHFLQ